MPVQQRPQKLSEFAKSKFNFENLTTNEPGPVIWPTCVVRIYSSSPLGKQQRKQRASGADRPTSTNYEFNEGAAAKTRAGKKNSDGRTTRADGRTDDERPKLPLPRAMCGIRGKRVHVSKKMEEIRVVREIGHTLKFLCTAMNAMTTRINFEHL